MKKIVRFAQHGVSRVTGFVNNAVCFVKVAHDTGVAYMEGKNPFFGALFSDETGRGGRSSGGGSYGMDGLLMIAVVGMVIYMLITNFWPTMSTQNQTIQGDTHTDSGTTTSKSIFALLLWLIPLGIGLALILQIFHFGKR